MNPTMLVLIAFAAGIFLGAMYFGTLWATVQVLAKSRRPMGLLFFWFVVRSSLVLGGFYLVWGSDLNRLIACVAGFLVARAVCVHIFGREPRTPTVDASSPQPAATGEG